MSRTHYSLHRGVRRLRVVLGLPNSECARCNSERDRQATRTSSRTVVEQAVSGNVGANNSIVDLHKDVAAVEAGFYDKDSVAQLSGWSSYKFSPGGIVQTHQGRNRTFFQYSSLPSNLVGYGGVTNEFNAYCEKMGVSCCMTSDPADFQSLMVLKVVGNDEVLISHEGKSHILPPGESLVLKITKSEMLSDYSYRTVDCLPRISKMVNGNV